MYKYKKIAIYSLTILYIILTIIEMIYYFLADSNLFGVIYLILSLFIIFLLVPICYNYKKYYSTARISKLIIVIVLGIFSSYILKYIVLNSMNYIDYSKNYIKSIFIYKNVFKGIIYFILTIFTIFEFKLDKVLIKSKNNVD